jgi:regulatory protein
MASKNMSGKLENFFKIQKIKRGPVTARVTIDSLEKPLIVPLELVEREALKEKMLISALLLEKIKSEAEQLQCETRAAGILSRRDHSVGELKRKLRQKEFSEDSIGRVVSFYKKKGLLDDKSYAEKVVSRQMAEKPSGRPYLIALLRNKLIHRELAEKTVQALYQNEDELTLAVNALSKRWRRYSQFELEEARRKAYNYLSRKGFSYGTARDAFDRLKQHQEEY